MSVQIQTKAAVTVAEMARMCGLSRSRFYQLLGSAFPHPLYDVATRRPVFTEEQQEVCLEVRRRNCGIDGKPILFYARRPFAIASKPVAEKVKTLPKSKSVSLLIEGLNSLGLTTATGAHVEQVTKELFPNGTQGIDQSEVLKTVFLHLKRKNTADNVGR